ELAMSLRQMLRREGRRERGEPAHLLARRALDRLRPRRILGETVASAEDDLVGSFITRAGPLPPQEITSDTARNLRSLQLRPMFVGIERKIVAAVIEGDAERIRQTMRREVTSYGDNLTRDRGGTWLAHVGGAISVD